MLTISLFLLALSLLILIHEFGHFIPAKVFGMRVEKFYLFFDWPRKLFSWRRGQTEYGIGILPLGGYVKIAGMIDESQIGKSGGLPSRPAPDEFRAKPLFQRVIVVLGGPVMNVLFGIFLLAVIFYINGFQKVPLAKWAYGMEAFPLVGMEAGDRIIEVNGEPAFLDMLASPEWLLETKPTLTLLRGRDTLRLSLSASVRDSLFRLYGQGREVFALRFPARIEPVPKGPADRAGLRTGDLILEIEGRSIESFAHMRKVLQTLQKDSVSLLVKRGEETFSIGVKLDAEYRLQAYPSVELPVERAEFSFPAALLTAVSQSYRITAANLRALFQLITGRSRISDNLAGPIGIAQMAGRSFVTSGWTGFWAFTATLSLILAVMNLLPIPLLDGGHLLFLGLEAIFRREPSYRLREVAQYIGLGLILFLMIFAFWNDLRRL
ncbi:MAG: RIP metalloprotease RseP [Bacteroidia bacterium]|nr:RIP metalloprotease RseP [Bacteroidia bacterium]MDW8015295.1 RIP metalloprotease RseP [Bacteroidia bacterium]